MSAQQGLRRMAQPFTTAPRPFTGPNPARQQQSRASAVATFACSSRAFAAAAARQITAAPLSSSGSRRRERKMVVRANWGAPVEFSTAKLVSNSKVAQQLHKVVVDVGDLAAGYAKGGQFMQIKVGEGKPGFFAISSPPDPNNQGMLEFLIKAQGEDRKSVV